MDSSPEKEGIHSIKPIGILLMTSQHVISQVHNIELNYVAALISSLSQIFIQQPQNIL
jgi:hypothetical protein